MNGITKSQRIVNIINLLYNRKFVTRKDILKQCNISARTFYRDINCISELNPDGTKSYSGDNFVLTGCKMMEKWTNQTANCFYDNDGLPRWDKKVSDIESITPPESITKLTKNDLRTKLKGIDGITTIAELKEVLKDIIKAML